MNRYRFFLIATLIFLFLDVVFLLFFLKYDKAILGYMAMGALLMFLQSAGRCANERNTKR